MVNIIFSPCTDQSCANLCGKDFSKCQRPNILCCRCDKMCLKMGDCCPDYWLHCWKGRKKELPGAKPMVRKKPPTFTTTDPLEGTPRDPDNTSEKFSQTLVLHDPSRFSEKKGSLGQSAVLSDPVISTLATSFFPWKLVATPVAKNRVNTVEIPKLILDENEYIQDLETSTITIHGIHDRLEVNQKSKDHEQIPNQDMHFEEEPGHFELFTTSQKGKYPSKLNKNSWQDKYVSEPDSITLGNANDSDVEFPPADLFFANISLMGLDTRNENSSSLSDTSFDRTSFAPDTKKCNNLKHSITEREAMEGTMFSSNQETSVGLRIEKMLQQLPYLAEIMDERVTHFVGYLSYYNLHEGYDNIFDPLLEYYLSDDLDETNKLKSCIKLSSYAEYSYLIFDKCPKSYYGPRAVVKNCEKGQVRDYPYFNPVYKPHHGIFRNKHCVLCHGLSVKDIVFLPFKFYCDDSDNETKSLIEYAVANNDIPLVVKLLLAYCKFRILNHDKYVDGSAFRRSKCISERDICKGKTFLNFLCQAVKMPTMTQPNPFCLKCGDKVKQFNCTDDLTDTENFKDRLPSYSLLFDGSQEGPLLLRGSELLSICKMEFFDVVYKKCTKINKVLLDAPNDQFYPPTQLRKYNNTHTMLDTSYVEVGDSVITVSFKWKNTSMMNLRNDTYYFDFIYHHRFMKHVHLRMKKIDLYKFYCSDVEFPIWLQETLIHYFDDNLMQANNDTCNSGTHLLAITNFFEILNVLLESDVSQMFLNDENLQNIIVLNTVAANIDLTCDGNDKLINFEVKIFNLTNELMLVFDNGNINRTTDVDQSIILAIIGYQGPNKSHITVKLSTWVCEKASLDIRGIISVTCNTVSLVSLFCTVSTYCVKRKAFSKTFNNVLHLSVAMFLSQLTFQVR